MDFEREAEIKAEYKKKRDKVESERTYSLTKNLHEVNRKCDGEIEKLDEELKQKLGQ